MAKKKNQFDEICWVPGIVQRITKPFKFLDQSIPESFTILTYDREESEHNRKELIRIKQYIYGFALNYIISINQ